MTQAKAKSITIAEYLEYDDGSDVRYDLLSNGELVEVPSLNNFKTVPIAPFVLSLIEALIGDRNQCIRRSLLGTL